MSFWHPIKEPPFVRLHPGKKPFNWSGLFIGVAVFLTFLMLFLGAFADQIVLILKWIKV